MAKVFNLSAHRRLWKWLAENPTKRKANWPEWIQNGGTVAMVGLECFACSYSDNCHALDDCPLIWPLNNQGSSLCTRGGLWDVWDDIELEYRHGNLENMCEEDKRERTRLALLIMNLPVKEDVEYV